MHCITSSQLGDSDKYYNMDLLRWEFLVFLGIVSTIVGNITRYLIAVVNSKKEVELAKLELKKELKLVKYQSKRK